MASISEIISIALSSGFLSIILKNYLSKRISKKEKIVIILNSLSDIDSLLLNIRLLIQFTSENENLEKIHKIIEKELTTKILIHLFRVKKNEELVTSLRNLIMSIRKDLTHYIQNVKLTYVWREKHSQESNVPPEILDEKELKKYEKKIMTLTKERHPLKKKLYYDIDKARNVIEKIILEKMD